MQYVGNQRIKPKRSPEQIKQDKINKIKDDITKLRQKKALLRLELQQQQQNARRAEFKARLDAIDQKVAEKMQDMRDVAMGAVRNLRGPGEIAQRAWDNWRI